MELNAFQHQLEEKNDSTKESLIKTYLLELAMFASICEENANIRDLSIAAWEAWYLIDLRNILKYFSRVIKKNKLDFRN